MTTSSSPETSAALLQQGLELHKAGRVEEAAAAYEKVIAIEPANTDALHLLGAIRTQRGDPQEGERLIASALEIRPDVAMMWFNHGNALAALDRREAAVASFSRAVELTPDLVIAHYGLVEQLIGLGRPADALAAAERAFAGAPRHHVLLTAKGNALMALGRWQEALEAFDQAVAASQRNVDALVGRGLALLALERPGDALPVFDRVLALVSGHVDSIIGRAQALVLLGRAPEALAAMDRVLSVVPKHPLANYVRGHALLALFRTTDAAESFRVAAASEPVHLEAVHNHADALRGVGRYAEAMPIYERVLAIDPQHAHAMTGLAESALQCCDWQTTRRLAPRLEQAVKDGRRGITPFMFLSISDSQELQLTCARTFIRYTCPEPAAPLSRRTKAQGSKLRIGYLSSDFRRHAMAYQMAELFEVHDRTRFEVVGFSGGPDDGSPIRKRIAKAFDGFHDVTGLTKEQIARLIHDKEIDVAVDLNGNTAYTLVGALAWRPAPVQATYLGFPGTTGARFVDYVIADETVAPLADQQYFSERIVLLPGCYQVSDGQRKPARQTPSRAAAGLPEDAFVFCCFNTSYKISETIFDVWMRVLAATPGSVLWLVKPSDVVADNLRRAATERGVDPGRLVFCGMVEPAEHLARHALADLFLDTLPYNSHGTGSFALWGGLPLLTCLGPTFPGRVAASLLKAVGLPELITGSLADYEATAIALTKDRARLAALQAKLAENRLSAPLFDTTRFRRHIEHAYATMHEIAMRGEAPRSFAVAPLD